MKLFLIAGEPSGDALGAALMEGLKSLAPGIRFTGIGGPLMQAQGMGSLFPMEELSVMGLAEVLPKYLHLKRRIRETAAAIEAEAPDAVITIDSPDFCLRVLAIAKAAKPGLKTVHYVAPSVWAWREKRIFKIARATNMVLALLPFEKAFYDKHQVPCTFVGHSLADDIPLTSDKVQARSELGLPGEGKILALMPGSRGGELSRLVPVFLESARLLLAEDPGLTFVVPMISERRAEQFNALHQEHAPDLPLTLIVNKTQQVMAASDCLLMASGTVTLEAALIKRPMVITYKFNALTYLLGKALVKLKWFSLPNLLANRELVPELLQHQVTSDNILPLLKERLYQDQSQLNEAFTEIHHALRQDASAQAAKAVLTLVKK